MSLIEMIDVCKRFRGGGHVDAVEHLSLRIEAGTMLGYAGPNGAGKSTTIKMLTGILAPTSGQITVAGFRPARDRTRLARQIGVVFGQRSQLWWDLPLRESLDLLRHVYRIDAKTHAATLARLVDALELGEFLDRPVRELSLGQRVRSDLAAALLHQPPILFLDEPTIALDVVAKMRVRALLADVNRERGTTVILTTHDMDDIERLCNRIVIIDRGHIVHDGDVASVASALGHESTLVITTEKPEPALEIQGAIVRRVDGVRQWLSFRRDRISVPSLIAAVNERVELADLSIEEPSMEDTVARMYLERRKGAPGH